MPHRVRCDSCGTENDLSAAVPGQAATCQNCGAAIQVPGAGPVPSNQAGPLGTVKAVAILNIVAGGLGLLWGLLMLIEAVAGATGMLPHERGDPPLALMVLICLVMLALAVAGGIFVLFAGVKLLQRKPGARKLAFAAGIVNCAGVIWACCAGVLTLPVGIFTLIVLSREDVKRLVE